MPLYEFRCRACGRTFERLLSASYRPEEVRCLHCGEAAVEKLFSAFASAPTSTSGATSGAHSCGTGFG